MKYKIEKIKVNCFDEYSTICNLTEAVNQIIDAISDLTSRVENLEAHVSHLIETEPKPEWPHIGDTIFRFNSQGYIKKEIWQDSAD